jgi:hypothetical protein
MPGKTRRRSAPRANGADDQLTVIDRKEEHLIGDASERTSPG